LIAAHYRSAAAGIRCCNSRFICVADKHWVWSEEEEGFQVYQAPFKNANWRPHKTTSMGQNRDQNMTEYFASSKGQP
jgi:hypothetical protein